MTTPPEPVFDAPWHAQAFAVAVHLNDRGLFSWPDWAAVFSDCLARAGADRALNGGDDYFLAWIEALERICTERGLAETAALAEHKARWHEAYLTTPHGAPVRLGG